MRVVRKFLIALKYFNFCSVSARVRQRVELKSILFYVRNLVLGGCVRVFYMDLIQVTFSMWKNWKKVLEGREHSESIGMLLHNVLFQKNK